MDGLILLYIPKDKLVLTSILLNHAKLDAAVQQEGDLASSRVGVGGVPRAGACADNHTASE